MHRDVTTTEEAIAIRYVIHHVLTRQPASVFPRRRAKRGPRQGWLPGGAARPRPQLGFA
jgi:hypothetical protein